MAVGAGCRPCVSHHLKAGAGAGLEGEQLLVLLAVELKPAIVICDDDLGKRPAKKKTIPRL